LALSATAPPKNAQNLQSPDNDAGRETAVIHATPPNRSISVLYGCSTDTTVAHGAGFAGGEEAGIGKLTRPRPPSRLNEPHVDG
jgi:hypothetical protein